MIYLLNTTYAPFELVIKNETEQDAAVSVIDLDWEHLCIQGYSESSDLQLPTLAAGESFILRPAVCRYLPENGERDNDVLGKINISTASKKEPFVVAVPWSFIPVLQFQDSG